ncbi:hypothetical protein TWF730_009464 [Orbilia blumenaviensis]|uniref:Inhibitor I9 domain-containing protein n=1 Tax=Orbilia blumenaviensis TaxID=1796055 RepID=A0AAV9V1N7_9PEZI
MQFKLFSVLLCLFITFVSAAAILTGREEKVGYVVSFKDGTPSSIIDFTIKKLKEAGAEITHEFSIIKGFAMRATETAVTEFETLKDYAAIQSDWKPIIEKDGPVGINAVGGGLKAE